MRKARYDMKQVVCPRSSCLGHSSNIAKPGYWVGFHNGGWTSGGSESVGRVLGRIAETDQDGDPCKGYLVVMTLFCEHSYAGIRWVHPEDVTNCYEKPPAALLAWITGDDWVKSKHDIARLIAMSQHGTTSEGFINSRDDADKPYNSRPEYAQQYILS